MKLKEYIQKYNLDVTQFAARCNVAYSSMYEYIRERIKPRQKVAERIEKNSDNLVTVKELRGEDDRERKRDEDVDNTSSNDVSCDQTSCLYRH